MLKKGNLDLCSTSLSSSKTFIRSNFILFIYLLMGFIPVMRSSGKSVELPVEASATITKGDALEFDGGYAQRATSASTDIRFVAAEDCDNSAGSDGDKVVNAIQTVGVRFEGTTAGTAAQTHVGTFIDLTDHDTLNQAASTTNVFYVDEFVDTATVRGHFVSNVA